MISGGDPIVKSGRFWGVAEAQGLIDALMVDPDDAPKKELAKKAVEPGCEFFQNETQCRQLFQLAYFGDVGRDLILSRGDVLSGGDRWGKVAPQRTAGSWKPTVPVSSPATEMSSVNVNGWAIVGVLAIGAVVYLYNHPDVLKDMVPE